MPFRPSPSPDYQHSWYYVNTVCSAEKGDYITNTNPAPGGSLQVVFGSSFLAGLSEA